MSGETDLSVLLRSAKPEHNLGNYVFCHVSDMSGINISKCVMMFKESESITLVLTQDLADEWALEYSAVFSWITLTIHSSLEAVGLTAAFSTALAKQNISCNVVAAFYHDHIFVGVADLETAMDILSNL